MADILSKGVKASYPGGVKTPSQTQTISGPGIRMDNGYSSKKQTTLPIVGKNK